MQRISFRIALFALLAAGSAHAATILVQPDGTGDQPTIQAAVDAAVDGDQVLLADGVFTGSGNRDISFQGKAITVRSQSGNAADCIVDVAGVNGNGEAERGFVFENGEGSASVLAAITIRNGSADGT